MKDVIIGLACAAAFLTYILGSFHLGAEHRANKRLECMDRAADFCVTEQGCAYLIVEMCRDD